MEEDASENRLITRAVKGRWAGKPCQNAKNSKMTKHNSTRHLLAATTMITGPYRSGHHMITSATSRRSLRAADGLRRPSESRAFLASRSTIYLDDACGSSRDRWTFPIDLSMTQGRTGDPKTMVRTSGIIGIGPSPSGWHRRIPLASP